MNITIGIEPVKSLKECVVHQHAPEQGLCSVYADPIYVVGAA